MKQNDQPSNWLGNSALAISLFIFVGLLFIRVNLIFTYSLDLEGVEQDEIYTIQRVLAGFPVYEDPEQPPFSITQKTPLYHYLCLTVGKIFQVSPDQPREVYLLNRWTSLILSLCTLIVGYFIQRRLFSTSIKVAITICALMFICYEPHMYDRPDSLYSFLFLITIALLWHYTNPISEAKKSWILILTAIMCAIVMFSKQSGIILPALCGGFILFFERNIRRVLLFGGVFIAGLGIMFLLTIALPGMDTAVFTANVFKGVQNGIDLTWAWEFIYNRSYKKFSLFFIIGFLIIIDWFFITKTQDDLRRITAFSMLGTFLFANLTGLKSGSTPSYFTEFVNLTLIAMPVYYRDITGLMNKEVIKRFKVIIFLGLLFLIPVQTSNKNLIAPFKLADPLWFANCAEVKNYAQQNLALGKNEWIYTDDELLKLYLFRNILLPQDDIYMTSPFSYKNFWNSFKNGRVKYIISSNTPENIFAMEANLSGYQAIDSVGNYFIYQRR